METYTEPFLIYGFEAGNCLKIDKDYLQDFYPEIKVFADKYVRNVSQNIIYGVKCTLDVNTGKVDVEEKSKCIVNELFDKYVKFLRSDDFLENVPDQITLGFHLGITYSIGIFHDPIRLD